MRVLFGEPRRRSFRVKSLSSEWWEIVALSNRLTGHDWKGGGLEIAKLMLILGKISPKLPESDRNKAKLALVTLGTEQDSFEEVNPATIKPAPQGSQANMQSEWFKSPRTGTLTRYSSKDSSHDEENFGIGSFSISST